MGIHITTEFFALCALKILKKKTGVDKKMKIVVLGGGISTERDVSLTSSRMIYQALKKLGHQAILLDVYLGLEEEDVSGVFESDRDWAEGIGNVAVINPDVSAIKAMRKDGGKSFFGPNVIKICQMADIVFLGLHGENGENGKVQAAFDLFGIRYTGTDYVSSALAMDKKLAKELFFYHNIPTPKSISVRKGEKTEHEIQVPCVVKVCSGGSSVGVVIVNTKEEYEQALEEAFRYDDEVLVEQYIKGREFTCGVIEGKALPIVEIAPKEGFYDYKNKYQAGSTVETCPAHLEEDKTKEIQRISEKVFEVLRLKKYALMDFMMSEEGEIYCLEANTLPGMTPTSLIPQEAAAVGMSFEQLCQKIVDISMDAD